MQIALGIEYEGSRFCGWQIQHHAQQSSVQAAVEQALSRVADHPVQTYCAGRTDAGVHALEQVVHFVSSAQRNPLQWVLGTNSYLPAEIRVLWAQKVPDDFHARFSALARRYYYLIDTHSVRSALFAERLSWQPRGLDAEKMHAAAQYLLGEHDFTSFRSADCQSNTPWRCVQEINVTRQGTLITIDIKANAFLHHMVRNIAGVLMTIGLGQQPSTWSQEVLAVCDRRLAAATAPPFGLYFAKAYYPEQYSLPQRNDYFLISSRSGVL